MAKIIYNGKNFVQGIPARDLTQEEWDALPEELKDLAVSSGIYKIENKPASKMVQQKEGE